jgi:hypothetical protein
MARVPKKSILSKAKGKIGDEIVVKQYGYGTVITRCPDMSRVKRSALQKKENSLFKEAVKYAQGVIRDPKRKAEYSKKLKKGKSVYHAAIQEYLEKNKKKYN